MDICGCFKNKKSVIAVRNNLYTIQSGFAYAEIASYLAMTIWEKYGYLWVFLKKISS
jgi:hypothetical protein